MKYRDSKLLFCGLLVIILTLSADYTFANEDSTMSIDQLLLSISAPSDSTWRDYDDKYLMVQRFLKGKNEDEITGLMKAVPRIKSESGRLAVLRALKNAALPKSGYQELKVLFNDKNALVRIALADLLPPHTPWLEPKVQLCIGALSSDDPGVSGDPPVPAVLLAKDVLGNLPQTKDVRKLLYSAVPKNEDVLFFHLVDALRSRELNCQWVLNYTGKVLPEDARTLRLWWKQGKH